MRVLHVIYDHPDNPWVGGGGAVRAVELNRRLAARGHLITMLCGNFPAAKSGPESDNPRFIFTGSPSGYVSSTLSFALRAAGFVRRHGHEYDVVVEDFAPWNPAFSSLMSRTPAVLHINHREGFNILRRRPLTGLPFYLIDRLYHRLFGNVTALSQPTRRKVGRKDALVLPAGVDDALLEELAGSPPPARKGFVLYVGRLEINNKGLDTLLEAMALLPGTRLLMAGRGRDEDRLKAMAARKGLDVEFLGFVSEEEKIRLLREAALLVLPSRFEGWGIVLLEAAACGTPTVVSDIEELSFPVQNGFGLRFRLGQVPDLAKSLGRILREPALTMTMSANALHYVRQYTWQTISLQYEHYLRGITGQ